MGYPRRGCCPPGDLLCAGTCRPPCPGNQRIERVNCTCGCTAGPQGCSGGLTWDPVLCLCACPATPCPDYRMVRNAACVCECPEGLTDCYGYCTDLSSDPLFCGSCDATPCDPFTEHCCNGTCINVCTDASCGDCDRQVGSGEKCCNCTPTKLGTSTNCSDCGDVCTGGRTCVNGTCQCPSTSRACAPGAPCCPDSRDCCAGNCCATGLSCCDGSCVNLKTSPTHCGACDMPCTSPRTCVDGTCQCPSGTESVGTCCCPAGRGAATANARVSRRRRTAAPAATAAGTR
jgi:hypothetical protein